MNGQVNKNPGKNSTHAL